MSIRDQIRDFEQRYARQITVQGSGWQYYRLGQGPAVLWLTGGLRRTALAFDFLERLSKRYTVITPDYPPVMTIHEYLQAFDLMLQAENVERCSVAGQSYGGMLAQAWLAYRPQSVERLIMSSSGPADYGRRLLPVESIFITLAHLLPERFLLKMLAGSLFKLVSVQELQRAEWQAAFQEVFEHQLTRADVVSHFAVAADLIRSGLVNQPGCFRDWTGRIVVLSSQDDITQDKADLKHYEKMFSRQVEWVDLGQMGHTAVLFDPQRFLDSFEQALG